MLGDAEKDIDELETGVLDRVVELDMLELTGVGDW
jgi:hypothetical protein